MGLLQESLQEGNREILQAAQVRPRQQLDHSVQQAFLFQLAYLFLVLQLVLVEQRLKVHRRLPVALKGRREVVRPLSKKQYWYRGLLSSLVFFSLLIRPERALRCPVLIVGL